LEAPHDTKREDERRGERIEGTGVHRSPSPLGSAKSRAAGLSLDPPPLAALGFAIVVRRSWVV
jgi:hypothetical protein